nr:unnamed protein product [Digitaria exilis]
MPPQATNSSCAATSPSTQALRFLSAVTLNGVASMPASTDGSLSRPSFLHVDVLDVDESQEEMTLLRVWLGVRSKEVTPVDTVTGSSISSMEMGHRNS